MFILTYDQIKQAISYVAILIIALTLTACGGGASASNDMAIDSGVYADTRAPGNGQGRGADTTKETGPTKSKGGKKNNTTDSGTADTQATLSWVAPSTRTDMSALAMTEISGYNIYMGDGSNNLVLITTVSDAYTMSYQVTNLATGTHYFAVTTLDSNGIESDLSSIVSKSI